MLRDTANESRYDVGLQVSCQCSFFVIRVALFLSSQCVTLGSSLYYLVEIKSSGSK
ncbi:hypothetical protein [Wolbachia endosymbiont of Aedes albopictus]|uniref:hypothetical protein n=1 Tax=Wolbachia endosymbiont of Aedes albopictus TaxID=167957 RepID=UPI0021672297|nr:hypothetical protein [Wolbachia endosymbiont of Aedes albopictus]UVW83988.1 hypothetical protein NHG98_00480 [Wolbachia endosymbiont of Aedes albopictus]